MGKSRFAQYADDVQAVDLEPGKERLAVRREGREIIVPVTRLGMESELEEARKGIAAARERIADLENQLREANSANDKQLEALRELTRQIDINDFEDSNGHKAKMLAAFLVARGLVQPDELSVGAEA